MNADQLLLMKRWRLALGPVEPDTNDDFLSQTELGIDRVLDSLYGGKLSPAAGKKHGSLSGSSPNIATWLGDIRQYFPTSMVQVMQQDALDRFDLRQILLEPELLSTAEPDLNLVTALLSLKHLIPAKTVSTARTVVQTVIDRLRDRIQGQLVQSVRGALRRSVRKTRPSAAEIDWHQTIRKNLKHYQKEYRTVIPEHRVGFGRQTSSICDIILCIDQSGSMAESVVYGAVYGSVLASIPSLKTSLVTFDTAVVDLSWQVSDPVELLFGVQLGGGTDIDRALAYCRGLIEQPAKTILVLITDLYEGNPDRERFIKRAAQLVSSGVTVICLLALTDNGAPAFSHEAASNLASLGIPTFACTPDLFPDLMSAAIQKSDLFDWTAARSVVTVRGSA